MINTLKQLAFSFLMLSIIGFTLLPLNNDALRSCEHAGMDTQINSQFNLLTGSQADHCEDNSQTCRCDNCNCNSHLTAPIYIDLIKQSHDYSIHPLDNKIQINHLYSQHFSNPLLRPPII